MSCTDRQFTLSTHCVLITYLSLDSTAMATPSTVLDVSPYNTFSLNCSVFVKPFTTPNIAYQWTGNNVAQPSTANTAASATTAGSSSYQCNATVNVPVLNPVVTNVTTTVTVRGKKQMFLTVCTLMSHSFWRAIVAYSSCTHNHLTYEERIIMLRWKACKLCFNDQHKTCSLS